MANLLRLVTTTRGLAASVAAGLCLVLVSQVASAELTSRDVQVVARTLGFLETPLTGTLAMGIVHDPGNTSSRQQAESIVAMLGGGLRVGNLQLRPVLVPLAEMAGAQVDFFLMTEFLGRSAATVPMLLHERQLTCITTDLQQVRDGFCVISVQSAPRVEIVVNSVAAELSGTRFSTVFRMMIKEI
jgi:hypothetical protein